MGKARASSFSARRVLAGLRDAVVVTDTAGRLVYLNAAAERLIGGANEELTGRTTADVLRLVDEAEETEFPDPVAACLRGPPWCYVTPFGSHPVLIVGDRGERLPVELSANAIMEDGQPDGVVMIVREDDPDRLRGEETAYHATHDPLTRLANRAEFTSRLQRVIDSGHGPHTLLYLDLDRFKEINEEWGHAAGDYALREITRLFSGMIRARDTFARLGGDEFALLMEHCGHGIAEQIANNFHATLVRQNLAWKEHPFSLDVSIGGLFIAADEIRTVEQLVDTAEHACRIAKEDAARAVHFDD